MNELVSLQNWEKAKYAIEQCRTMDEVKDIRDKAAALAAYAKQARTLMTYLRYWRSSGGII